jgi:hypothetical protein
MVGPTLRPYYECSRLCFHFAPLYLVCKQKNRGTDANISETVVVLVQNEKGRQTHN